MTKALSKATHIDATQNAAQTLLANIRLFNVDEPVKTVVVTSACEGEGKTTIAIQLARTIVQGEHKTLLVDCDLRAGTLVSDLGIADAKTDGLVAALTSEAPLDDLVSDAGDNLFVLAAPTGVTNPPELLASKRFREFVANAKDKFDYVVFDTPAVTSFVDAALVASCADATVMVVRENFGDRGALVDAHEQLVASGAKMVGIAINCFTGARSQVLNPANREESTT